MNSYHNHKRAKIENSHKFRLNQMIDDLIKAVQVNACQNLYNVFGRIIGILIAELSPVFLTERIVARLVEGITA